MPESLGETFKTAREARGMSIDQMAALTKLNASFIIALEDGRWDLLPGRVYLKPFTKIYGEALGLNVEELYGKIDGITPEEKKQYVAPPSEPIIATSTKKKIDYKIPTIMGSLLIIIVLIALAVKYRNSISPPTNFSDVIPAKPFWKREAPKWEQPWEKPTSNPKFMTGQRLRLEARDNVWAMVIADIDTVFVGNLTADSGLIFVADSAFHLTLSRADKVDAYFNGFKLETVGAGKKVSNMLIAPMSREAILDETQ